MKKKVWERILQTYPRRPGKLKNCFLVVDGSMYYSNMLEKTVSNTEWGVENLHLAAVILKDVEHIRICNVHPIVLFQHWSKLESHATVAVPSTNETEDYPESEIDRCPIESRNVLLSIIETLYIANLFVLLTRSSKWKVCHGIAERFKCPMMTWNASNLLNQHYLGNACPIIYPKPFTDHVTTESSEAHVSHHLSCVAYIYEGEKRPINDGQKLPFLIALATYRDAFDFGTAELQYDSYSESPTEDLFKWIDRNSLLTCLRSLQPKSPKITKSFFDTVNQFTLSTDHVKREMHRLTIVLSAIPSLSGLPEVKFQTRQKPFFRDDGNVDGNTTSFVTIRYDWPILTSLGFHKEPVAQLMNSLCFQANTALELIFKDITQTALYGAQCQLLNVLSQSLRDECGVDNPSYIDVSETQNEAIETPDYNMCLRIEAFSHHQSFRDYMKMHLSLQVTETVSSMYAQYLACVLATWLRSTEPYMKSLLESTMCLSIAACSIAVATWLPNPAHWKSDRLSVVIDRFTQVQYKMEAYCNMPQHHSDEQIGFKMKIEEFTEFSVEFRRLVCLLDLVVVYGSRRLLTCPWTKWPSQYFFDYKPRWILLPSASLVFVLNRILSGISIGFRLKHLTESWLPELVQDGDSNMLRAVQTGLNEVITIVDNYIGCKPTCPD